MRIAFTISLDIDRERNTAEEPQPQGADAFVEHANRDSTPRLLGFTANPPEEYA